MFIWNCAQEWSQQFSSLLKKWATQVSMNSQWAHWYIHTRNEKEGTPDTTWRDSKHMCQMKNTRFQKRTLMAIPAQYSRKTTGKQISYCQICVLIKKRTKVSRGTTFTITRTVVVIQLYMSVSTHKTTPTMVSLNILLQSLIIPR